MKESLKYKLMAGADPGADLPESAPKTARVHGADPDADLYIEYVGRDKGPRHVAIYT